MTCPELLQAIDPYLDDELSVLEVLRVQAHLLRCEPCWTAITSEARLHALLEAETLQDQPPSTLRERIRERLAAVPAGLSSLEPPHQPFMAPYAVLVGAVLTAVLVAAAMLVRLPGPSALPPFIEEVASKHRAYTEAGRPVLDVKTGDVAQATAWLAGRLGFSVKAPTRLRSGERLLGGRVSSLADAPAAYLVYERDDHPMSLFVARRPASGLSEENKRTVEGMELYTGRADGLTLVWWEDNDLIYAAASAAGSRDLTEFALLCLRGRSSAAMDRLHPTSFPVTRTPNAEGSSRTWQRIRRRAPSYLAVTPPHGVP